VIEVIVNALEAHPGNKDLIAAGAGALTFLTGQDDVGFALRYLRRYQSNVLDE